MTFDPDYLPKRLCAQLQKIEPSEDSSGLLYPCSLLMNDGTIYCAAILRPYEGSAIPETPMSPDELDDLVEHAGQRDHWPREMIERAKDKMREPSPPAEELDLTSIAAIEPCPDRLPAKWANHIYAAGETGMGYYLFSLVMEDQSQFHFVAPHVDFPRLPPGQYFSRVKDVIIYEHSKDYPASCGGSLPHIIRSFRWPR